MKGRFPRTPAEFRDHGRYVALRCACGSAVTIKPDNLVQRLGPDFDLYEGFLELLDTFPRERCCALRQEATFGGGRHRPIFETVSFEEALANELELRAFSRARDQLLSDGLRSEGRGGGRRRKFGVWGR